MKRSQLLTMFFLASLLGFQLTYLFLSTIFAEKEMARPLTISAYQFGWIIIPILTILILLLFIGIKKSFFLANTIFFPILLLANLISSSISLFGWQQITPTQNIVLFLGAQIIGLLVNVGLQAKGYDEHYVHLTDIVQQFTLLFFLTGYLAVFLISYEIHISTMAIYCFSIAISCLLLYGYQTLTSSSWLKTITDIIVIILIILIVFDPRFYFNDFARHHQNFFLGPANDILYGKDVLINSYSQYGLFMPYFLAFIFRIHLVPMTYQGFTLFISGLYGLYYSVIYFFLRRMLYSQWLAIITIGALLFFNYLAVWWRFMPIIPAQGPLRFLWVYLILAAEILLNCTHISPKQEKIISLTELVIVGMTAIWSIEVFIYTLLTFLTCQFFRSLSSNQSTKEKIKQFLGKVGLILVTCLSFWFLFLVLIIIRSHQLPQFNEFINYLRFLTTYTYMDSTEESIYSVTDFIQRYWVIGPAVFFGTLFGCILYLFSTEIGWERKKNYSPIAGLTVFGVVQFTYFFVFSFTGHFALVCVPVIILAAFWLSELLRHDFPIHIKTSVAVGYIIIVSFFAMQYSFYVTNDNRWSHTGLQYSIQYFASLLNNRVWPDNLTKRFMIYHPWNEETLEAEKLVNQYFKHEQEIPIFIESEDEVETLVRVGKAHIYPISNPNLVQVVPQIEALVMAYPVKFYKGDRILVSNDRSKISTLEQELLAQINRKYYLFPIVISENYTIYEVG